MFDLHAGLRGDVVTITVTDHGRFESPRDGAGSLRGRGLVLIETRGQGIRADPARTGLNCVKTWDRLTTGVESLVEELSRKTLPRPRTPRDCLSSHPRRTPRTRPVRWPAPAEQTPRARHPPRCQGADLLLAGGVRAALVRENRDIPALARDHGISRATGYRYLNEVIEVLAAQAPDLHDARRRAKDDGATHVILDGKLFSSDRLGEKTISVKGEQVDLVVLRESPRAWRQRPGPVGAGRVPVVVSDVEPGSVHDLTAAREHVLGALYWAASQLKLPTLADGGYQGAGIGVLTPIKHSTDGHVLDVDNRSYNALFRGLRCLSERAFALLVGRWRALRHITASPRKIGAIVKAALVLTQFEHGRLS